MVQYGYFYGTIKSQVSCRPGMEYDGVWKFHEKDVMMLEDLLRYLHLLQGE